MLVHTLNRDERAHFPLLRQIQQPMTNCTPVQSCPTATLACGLCACAHTLVPPAESHSLIFAGPDHASACLHMALAELFNGSRVNEKCDIYSLGCIIYECVTGRAPWSELTAPPPLPPKPPRPPSAGGHSSSGSSGGDGNGTGASSSSTSTTSITCIGNSSHSRQGQGMGGGGGGAGQGVAAVPGGGAVMPQGGMGALFQVSVCVCVCVCVSTCVDLCVYVRLHQNLW